MVVETHRTLPRKILGLRENSLSLFVSNLPEEMSKVEFEAMFCRAGKTLYSAGQERPYTPLSPLTRAMERREGLHSSDLVLSTKLRKVWSWPVEDHGVEGR